MNNTPTEGNITVEGNLNELKPGNGVVVDDKTKYEYGSNLESGNVPLNDPATGKTVTLRTFYFKMTPEVAKKGNFPLDNQLLFNSHARQIKTILWGDGLIPVEDIAPRITVHPKKHMYQIFVLCEARANVLFMEKPKGLTEVLSKASKNGNPRHR